MKWREIYKFLTLGLLLALVGCVAGEGGKKTASCGPGQAFNSVTRKCQGAIVLPGPPRGTLDSISVLEDLATAETINLTYTDADNDFGLSCNVISNNNGLVKYLSYQNILIKSRPSVVDAHNSIIQFVPISFGSVDVTVTPTAGKRYIDITIPPSSTPISVAAAIVTDPDAVPFIDAFALAAGPVTGDNVERPMNNLLCNCAGGICTTQVEPTDDFQSATDFIYTITDKDGTSEPKTVLVNVTPVNDLPVIAQALPMPVAQELRDGDTGNSFVIDLDTYIAVTDTENNTAQYQWEIVNQPLHAANIISDGVTGVELNPFTGILTYRTFKEETSDTIGIRAVDVDGGASNTLLLSFSINNVNDAPVGTITSAPSVFEDSTISAFTLTITDEEGDSANICEVINFDKVIPTTDCLCLSPTSCVMNLATLPDQTGVASFDYRIFDDHLPLGDRGTPAFKTVTFNIVAQDDGPIFFPTVDNLTAEASTEITIRGDESDTFETRDYTFVLDGATDNDGHTINVSSYTITDLPDHGTLSGCLNQGASGLSCTYTPSDGNLADPVALDTTLSASYANATTDVGTFYSTALGASLAGLQIQMVANNTEQFITGLFSPSADAYAFASGPKVMIIFEPAFTTASDVSAAIAANPDVAKLIQLDEAGAGAATQTAETTLTLSGGTNTADSFTVEVEDSNDDTSSRTFHISINPVPDRPTMCEYSTYDETTACGLNGCVSDGLPGSITPDQDGLVFYSRFTGSCYVSSGGTWNPLESFVGDKAVNELESIVVDNILIDEGGGTSEDFETVEIVAIDSSDENLVPLGNIEMFYGPGLTPINIGDSLPDGGGSVDQENFRLVITPQTINPPIDEKASTIEITLEDSTGIRTEVTFNVVVRKSSATHGGWANFKATGPKVDSFGLVNEDRRVCPFSLDMCEDGQRCSGTSSPINNTAADPDHEDAIFMQETAGTITCYRMRRTIVQNIAYVGKSPNNVTIEYTDTVSGDNAVVNVNGNAITIGIDDDVTTTNTIITAIRGSSANALVKAINLKEFETQDPQAQVNISPLSNASWQSFETYCSATPVALEPGCNDGSRLSCMGTSSPVGVVQPTKEDSRFWDEQNNVCYRSTGTTVNSWETYDAAAEVEISWNQFNVNGTGSISEYRVYRRLAGEEFDFSKPINRNPITGSSNTYTFTDNANNSVVPPSPGTVYYYVVRPVINGLLSATAAERGTNAIGVVRMMAPPKNMAFAHRWMINKRICSIMNRATDSSNNYRCLYKGAGDTTVSGVQYYDYGKDILVDRFEAGCPYSPAPRCTGTFDNSCIGVGAPDDPAINLTPTADLIYYDRGEGKCYMANGTVWNELNDIPATTYVTNLEPNGGTIDPTEPQFDGRNDKRYHRSSLPPLTNVTQGFASTFCSGLDGIPASEILGVGATLNHRLPGRKDQIAYSVWDNDQLNDSQIASTETGLSLNSSSKCNSSSASGLESGYVNFDKPDSNDFYSLPGTDSSNIRSIATGSNETAACVSAFGVQDAVGNVAEWTFNSFHCPLLSQCFTSDNITFQGINLRKVRPSTQRIRIVVNNGGGLGVARATVGVVETITITVDGTDTAADVVSALNTPAVTALVTPTLVGDGSAIVRPLAHELYIGWELFGLDDTDFGSSDTNDPYGLWSLDGLRGPCVDADSDNICDANISFWAIEDERFSAGRFMTPMGLPVEISANSTFSTDYDLFEIGPTSGITSLQLHDDVVNFNSQVIFTENTIGGCGALNTGGSYLSGNGSGVYNMEALPCEEGFGVLSIQDITFKADSAADLSSTIRFVENADGDTNYATIVGGVLEIDLDDIPGGAIASNVVVAIANAFGGFDPPNSSPVRAYVTGDPNALQVAFTTPVGFTDLREEAVPKRVDVGFRCMIDIDPTDYD